MSTNCVNMERGSRSGNERGCNSARANPLIVVPEGPTVCESGDQVTVQVPDWESVAPENFS